jgi:hypothetical protein
MSMQEVVNQVEFYNGLASRSLSRAVARGNVKHIASARKTYAATLKRGEVRITEYAEYLELIGVSS